MQYYNYSCKCGHFANGMMDKINFDCCWACGEKVDLHIWEDNLALLRGRIGKLTWRYVCDNCGNTDSGEGPIYFDDCGKCGKFIQFIFE